jgi:hypothetical protein
MIKYYFALFLVSSFNVYGQDKNFTANDNGEIIWQDIITSDKSIDSILYFIKRSGYFENIDTLSNSIVGEIKRREFDYSKAKSSIWKSDLPGYMVMHDYSATFEVNFKPNKYRIVIKNIKCIGKKSNPRNNMFITKPDEIFPLNDFAFKGKKREFEISFTKYSVPILTYNFNNLFTFTEGQNSDW